MPRFASCLALLILLAPVASMAEVDAVLDSGKGRYTVTLRHQPVIACKSVHVAGSFNGWSKTKNPLRDPDGDGTYEATLELPRGLYHYKFVINGSVWQHDGDNPRTESDGHSGFNSILDLGGGAAKEPGQLGDGKVGLEHLIHDPSDLAHASAVDGRKRLVLRVHTLRDDVEALLVRATPVPREGKSAAARRIAVVKGRTVWEVRLSWTKAPSKVRYSFELEDGGQVFRYPVKKRERFTCSTKVAARLVTPDWVRDAVFYQIFPDRFRNGNPNNQPRLKKRPAGTPWHVDDRYLEEWDAKPSHFNFMGGDLAGITERADYIRSLGVNTLYLNPIFKAASNHRYDASDYETIDPALGTLDEFHELRDAFKKRGMRMILDCVFNHTGDSHYAFQDVMKKGKSSKFWDWYFIEGFPVVQSPKPNYKAWWGFGSLPQLNTKNPKVVDHLLKVSKQWLKEGSQGWRLDVPNDLDAVNPDFWPEFRRVVKKHDPDAYVVGEIWTDARAWLQGDKFDAVMNYPVRSAALEFCAKGGIDAKAFQAKLSQQLATYPEAALRVQFNLLGSHDTARLLTVAGGDSRRARLAMTFLYGWSGAPVLYYGDEVGLDGGKDPACRKTFPWETDRQDKTTLAHVRALGKLRQQERTLRRGTIRFVHGEGKVSAFVREAERGEPGRPVLCLLNSSDSATTVRIPLGELKGAAHRLLGEGKATREGKEVVVELAAYEGTYVALGGAARTK